MSNKAIIVFLFIFLIVFNVPYTHATNQEQEVKVYHWDFMGETYHLVLNITSGESSNSISKINGEWYIYLSVPESNYSYYKRYPGGYRYAFNFTYLQFFMTSHDFYIRELAHDLGYISEINNFDNLTRMNFLLSFVQKAMNYYDDQTYTGFYDYYKFPLETLVEGGGDCEDKSLLLATIAHDLGYDVVLFVLNVTSLGSTTGHVAVGVHFNKVNHDNFFAQYLRDYYVYHDKKYYYMETTANMSFFLGGVIFYYVGVSPEEAGYVIEKIGVVPYRDSTYHGYSPDYIYVKDKPAESVFPWYSVLVAIIIIVFIPVFIYSYLREPRRCPNCGYPVDSEWNYCPNCGYWLNYVGNNFDFKDGAVDGVYETNEMNDDKNIK